LVKKINLLRVKVKRGLYLRPFEKPPCVPWFARALVCAEIKMSSSSRDHSPSRKGSSKSSSYESYSSSSSSSEAADAVRPNLLIHFDGETQEEQRHVLLLAEHYTDKERKMLNRWTKSENIFTDFLVAEKQYLDDSKVKTMAEVALHNALYDRLEKLPDVRMNGIQRCGNAIYLHVNIFN
jgi:hypothetical protein